ncbi:MAG: hypothetical protein KF814_04225 [Nitrospiraceae bacterium]|nr:hypothetical protein [Nitrospiraceae bacterium]
MKLSYALIRLALALWSATLWPITALASEATDKEKAAANQGITLENMGRGFQIAVKNIGEEIPKIGPAIADTFKKVTHSDKDSDLAIGIATIDLS